MTSDKKVLHIFMKTGGVVTVEQLPDGFDFNLLCTSIKAVGFFNNGSLYIDYQNINAIAYAEPGGTVKGMTMQ